MVEEEEEEKEETSGGINNNKVEPLEFLEKDSEEDMFAEVAAVAVAEKGEEVTNNEV